MGALYEDAVLMKHPKRWPLVVAVIVLSVLVAVLCAGYVFSNRSAQAWRAAAESSASDVQSVSAERDGLKATVDELQAEADDLQAKLDEVTAGYNSATDRVRSLADEKAQVGDSAAFLAESLVMSQSVTTQMDECISGLQDLQAYLVDFESYDLESLITYAQSINDGCDRAREASADLSEKLGG